MTPFLFSILPAFILLLFSAACTPAPEVDSASGDDRLNVIATTTIVGDAVAQVAGDSIALTVLLPVGADPHSFDPAPQDAAALAKADIIFASGAGLEAFLEPLIENTGEVGRLVEVSENVPLLESGAHEHEDEKEHEGESAEHEGEHEDEGHVHEGGDPHTWTDPNNVILWVETIAAELSALDPAHAETYSANAAAYIAELEALDAWVVEQVAQIPEENRKIVSDHTLYTYFAERYGFTQVGAVIPGYSTLAEPSVQELAALQDAIEAVGVRAVFVGQAANPALAERLAEGAGVQLVMLYTGSLTEVGGDAPTYVDYIRYNVSAIVAALK